MSKEIEKIKEILFENGVSNRGHIARLIVEAGYHRHEQQELTPLKAREKCLGRILNGSSIPSQSENPQSLDELKVQPKQTSKSEMRSRDYVTGSYLRDKFMATLPLCTPHNSPEQTKWCPQHGYPQPCDKCGWVEQTDLRKAVAQWLYELTANQLLLANYFGNEPTYKIEWETLADSAKDGWRKDADKLLSLIHPELKVLSPEELIHLNEQWELEYEEVEMTDSEWELKRWGLISQAAVDSCNRQLGIALDKEGGRE